MNSFDPLPPPTHTHTLLLSWGDQCQVCCKGGGGVNEVWRGMVLLTDLHVQSQGPVVVPSESRRQRPALGQGAPAAWGAPALAQAGGLRASLLS